jgi:hypothetical protein
VHCGSDLTREWKRIHIFGGYEDYNVPGKGVTIIVEARKTVQPGDYVTYKGMIFEIKEVDLVLFKNKIGIVLQNTSQIDRPCQIIEHLKISV